MVTVMRVVLFVWEVSMLRECEGNDNDGGGRRRCGCGECGV